MMVARSTKRVTEVVAVEDILIDATPCRGNDVLGAIAVFARGTHPDTEVSKEASFADSKFATSALPAILSPEFSTCEKSNVTTDLASTIEPGIR
jgi:hypothetical protein